MMSNDDPLIIEEEEEVEFNSRDQVQTVENFNLLPGEFVLLQTPNVVHLSSIDNSHYIGTLYQTNYQFFLIEDTKKEVTMSFPYGLVMEIKKLKGHVTVKYRDGATPNDVSDNNSENNGGLPASSSTTTTTTATPIKKEKEKEKEKDKIPRSISNSSNISNVSDCSAVGGVSEKALILEIRCKDFNILRICLPSNERGQEAHQNLLKMSFLNEQTSTFFAQSYNPFKNTMSVDGWTVYDPIEEYSRQGLLSTGSEWRLTKINMKYDICNTYPQNLVVPCTIADYIIQKGAPFRSKNRFPVTTWRHRYTHASLSRCAQPLNSQGKHRSEEDEQMIQAIRKSTPVSAQSISAQPANQQAVPQPPAQLSVPASGHHQVLHPTQSQPLYIFDVRPKSTANSTFSGSSTEDLNNYSNCNIEFGGLSNIHELRECCTKLYKVIRNWDERKSWPDVNSTLWLNQISKILQASRRILHLIHVEGLSVVIHCTDGWDRTPQLMCTVQLLADPYYRTMKGFITLITKEWISFGHKFMTRNGTLTSQSHKQTSPLFLQFMDCVWQLTRQFPTSFEFSDKFIMNIIHHLNSNLFGTFLYDSDKERTAQKIQSETVSLWTFLHVCIKEGKFRNALYVETTDSDIVRSNEEFVVRKNYEPANVLFPNVQGIQLWTDFYLKWREPIKTCKKSMTLVDHALGVHGLNGDLFAVQKKKKGSRRHRNKSNSLSSSDNFKQSPSIHQHKDKEKESRSKKSRKSSSSIGSSITEELAKEEEFENNAKLATASAGVEIPKIELDILQNQDHEPEQLQEQEQEQGQENRPTATGSDVLPASASLPDQIAQLSVSQDENNQNTLVGEDDITRAAIYRHRRHSTSNSSPGKNNPLIDTFKETMSPRVDLVPVHPNITAPTEATPTTSNYNVDDNASANANVNASPKSERDRKEMKEQRKAKKEQREKEKTEKKALKEKKRQEKKEKEEKMTPEITVVLHNSSKSRPISLTLPSRGPKSSRISIISMATPPSPNTINAMNQSSPNLADQQQVAQTPPAADISAQQQPPQHTKSLSKLFKNLTVRGAKTANAQ